MWSRTYIFVGSTGGYFRNSVFKYLFIFLISWGTLNNSCITFLFWHFHIFYNMFPLLGMSFQLSHTQIYKLSSQTLIYDPLDFSKNDHKISPILYTLLIMWPWHFSLQELGKMFPLFESGQSFAIVLTNNRTGTVQLWRLEHKNAMHSHQLSWGHPL